ncbi:MAG: metabolite traffic protein EboE [Gammaproteobacteria bacterium]|nr:metabolite traffic protein EboE [Gammaproteobacteria bacterium]
MQIDGHANLGHLSYCTNIHAGEAWPDVIASLRECVPPIKQSLSPEGAFGIGLRLGAAAVNALQSPAAMQEMLAFLQEHDCYVFTLNGFPYGPFHGQAVKENAYAPDWRSRDRLDYTNQLADILVTLLGERDYGTISTVPGSFKPWLDGQEAEIAQAFVEHTAYLVKLQQETGKKLVLALEPEPFCLLETIEETVDFFNRHLFGSDAIAQLQKLSGLSSADSESALREHLGVCYDVCHAAVEFEDPVQSVEALRSAGIKIAKVQLSSAMRIAQVDHNTPQLLERFIEPVYLHQVVEQTSSGLRRFVDLPDALSNRPTTDDAEWRIHFHVPVFLERMQDFDTTQAFLKDILALHRKTPLSDHLEVETYTWDVLPDEYRNVDVSSAIARELTWVTEQLTQ